MLSFLDALRDINLWTVIFRLVLAFICGGAIGIERSYKNRPAGLRTHILVCIAATVASMTGIFLSLNMGLPTDISRLGAQVVSGLGFIGAGTIIITRKQTVRGLTTAAGLWGSGIIGLAVGAGFYEGAIITTVLILITETLFSSLVQRIKKAPQFDIVLRYHHKPALDQVLRLCKDNTLAITNLQVIGNNDDEVPVYSAKISLRPRQNQRVDHEDLLRRIREIPGVYEIEDEQF